MLIYGLSFFTNKTHYMNTLLTQLDHVEYQIGELQCTGFSGSVGHEYHAE